MSNRRRRRSQTTNAAPFSPIDLVPTAQRDSVIAARLAKGYVLWTEEKLEGFVRLRFLPSA